MRTVHQRHKRTDRRTTYDSNTALALRASRGKNGAEEPPLASPQGQLGQLPPNRPRLDREIRVDLISSERGGGLTALRPQTTDVIYVLSLH